MASASTFKTHYTKLLTLWPRDLLRPDKPFTASIQRRLDLYTPNPNPTPKTFPNETRNPSPLSTLLSKNLTSQSSLGPPPPLPPAAELANINALYSLLNNRYSKAYKLSPRVLAPLSSPEHYERVVREIERAPGKSWLQSTWEDLRAKVRFR